MEHDQRNIVIFPEGSRGTSDAILPFRKGAARFAQALKKPIVPIYISGSSKSWPKGKIFMRPCRITINILEPIEPRDYRFPESLRLRTFAMLLDHRMVQ